MARFVNILVALESAACASLFGLSRAQLAILSRLVYHMLHALPWTWTIKCVSDFIADLKWYLCFLCHLLSKHPKVINYYKNSDAVVVPVLSKNMHTPLFLKLIQRWDFLTMYCSELHNIGKQAAVSMGGTGSCWDRKMGTRSAGKEKCFSACLGER